MRSVSFRDLSSFSPLFADYVGAWEKVSAYYARDWRSAEAMDQHLLSLDARDYPREELAQVMREQARETGSDEATLRSIDALIGRHAVAVVTGQQVGLFGGPIYTVFKAASAVRYARELAARTGRPVVPIFWLETEDHDLDEASSATLLDAARAPIEKTYRSSAPGPEGAGNAGAVGALVFDLTITALVDEVAAMLPTSEFTAETVEALRAAYRAGRTFAEAFASLLAWMFHGTGLILFNARDARVKRLAAPMFRREIETTPRSSELVVGASAALEREYHAQVKARPTNLFLFWKNARAAIDPRPDHGDFWLKGTRQYFLAEELYHMVDEEPERFSPNVVLRPIVQDFLLPTAAYVGGPAEIAYFAQFRGVYEQFGVPMPPIVPRASATIVEGKVRSAVERLKIDVAEFLVDPDSSIRAAAERSSVVDVAATVGSARGRVDEAFGELLAAAAALDTSLVGAVEAARAKAEKAVESVEEKLTRAQKRATDLAPEQAEFLRGNLLPGGELQERVLNVLPYLARYGRGLVERMIEELPAGEHASAHAIFEL
jgi:bacillithiol biosynthesis cysteine-adding enzyme BshC